MSMASLRTICWRTEGPYYAIENTDRQWARLSARNLATITTIAAELRASGSPAHLATALVSDVRWIAFDATRPPGVYLVSEPDAWVARYVHSGRAFCVLTDADLLTIDAVHQRALGRTKPV
jgi:hypothetical protein